MTKEARTTVRKFNRHLSHAEPFPKTFIILQKSPNYLFAGSGKTAAYFLFECGEDVEDKNPKFFSVRYSLLNMHLFVNILW